LDALLLMDLEAVIEVLSAVAQVELTEVSEGTEWSTLPLNISKQRAPSTGPSHTSMAKRRDMKEVEVAVEFMANC